ncbi:glycosyltransferase [Miltoncostaea oceani]|uniref:glycosyltransferase n=1 Tax=Miltoncostaea oceani TaxID=2843216 RepID=UPI001C3D52EC|nr:glycosyltransferase [Miltoncostaea oceani]
MSADARVAAHRAALAALEERVVRLADGGDDALAAAWAQIAGDHAWHSPTGVVASPAIDGALRSIGLRTCPRTPRGARPDGPPRVLHVATEVAGVGGHSRMAWRWIERDTGRVPVVALTRQRGPVPEGLRDAVRDRGGALHHVEGHDALARARALAALVDDCDLVVLHVHPFEVAAAIALADRAGRPPVLHVNHADHCFWLGADVPDLVVSPRAAASRMAVARRGVPAERTAVLPVPVDPPVVAADRDAARAALGVPPGACALLVVASAYKLERIDDVGLLDLVEPIVAALPETVLLAVGPDDAGDWAAARERSGGRVRALGTVHDLSGVLAAGDVFLDGYPCSSLTAALEAAAAGMCVVSHQPPRPQAATYDIDEPALGAAHVRAPTPESYAAAIARLVADPAGRARAGAAAAAAVAAMADRGAWTAARDAAYARAADVAAAPPVAAPPITATADTAHEDAFLLRLHEASGMAIPVEAAVARGADAFPRDPAAGLAIVIHAHDDRAGLERLIASAVATCSEVEDVTAVVVDDGSRDGTADLLASLAGDIAVVTNPVPRGAAAAWPEGVARADGEAVLLVTSDVVLAPGWLAPLRAALARAGVSAVAPRIAGATGRETCVLTSLAAVRAGAAVTPVEVPESVVLGGHAAIPPLEAVA